MHKSPLMVYLFQVNQRADSNPAADRHGAGRPNLSPKAQNLQPDCRAGSHRRTHTGNYQPERHGAEVDAHQGPGLAGGMKQRIRCQQKSGRPQRLRLVCVENICSATKELLIKTASSPSKTCAISYYIYSGLKKTPSLIGAISWDSTAPEYCKLNALVK